MTILSLKQPRFHNCPGGTPPIFYGGREHCFTMPAKGLNGILGGWGRVSPTLLVVLAGIAGAAYFFTR